MPVYKSLVLGSGGLVGIYLMGGCMQCLYENGQLDEIDHYIGCSAGGVIMLLFLCGMTPKEIMSLVLSENVCDWGFCGGYSLTKGDLFKRMIKGIVGNTTLGDLPARVTVSTTNISKGIIEYIDTETHGDMTVLQACLMTGSIPIVFPPVEYKGDIYLDGAIKDSFPLGQVKVEPALGIFIERNEYSLEGSSILHYLKSIVSVVTTVPNSVRTPFCIVLKNGYNGESMECTPEMKVKLYLDGVDQCRAYIDDISKTETETDEYKSDDGDYEDDGDDGDYEDYEDYEDDDEDAEEA